MWLPIRPRSDEPELVALLGKLRERCEAKAGCTYALVSIQEARLDGFWIHRMLEQRGIEIYVVDPASIATPRRRKRGENRPHRQAGIVELTGDDRSIILSALLWVADRLKSVQGEHARAMWAAKGRQAFDADPATHKGADR